MPPLDVDWEVDSPEVFEYVFKVYVFQLVNVAQTLARMSEAGGRMQDAPEVVPLSDISIGFKSAEKRFVLDCSQSPAILYIQADAFEVMHDLESDEETAVYEGESLADKAELKLRAKSTTMAEFRTFATCEGLAELVGDHQQAAAREQATGILTLRKLADELHERLEREKASHSDQAS